MAVEGYPFIGLFAFSGWAEEKKKESQGQHYPFNFSIYYPLSINKSKKDSVNLNFSLVYGHVGSVEGIDLAAFGVNLTNVGSITIGIGTKDAPVPDGGTGTMYFDDIRLIR